MNTAMISALVFLLIVTVSTARQLLRTNRQVNRLTLKVKALEEHIDRADWGL